MVDKPESPIEAKLLSALRQIEDYSEPVFQHEIYNERGHLVTKPDFAFPNVKVAVFCDGRQYHEDPQTMAADKSKRDYIKSLDWLVLVYTGSEINADANRCAREVHAKYSLRSESLKDEDWAEDWQNREKPELSAGHHIILSALDIYSKKGSQFSRLDKMVKGCRYVTYDSALIAVNEQVFKTVFNRYTKMYDNLIDRDGLFVTRNGTFFIQHEYPNTKRATWIEVVGPSRAYEFYWNSGGKVRVPVNNVFKEVGVKDG